MRAGDDQRVLPRPGRTPVIYSHPLVYSALMRVLYGAHFRHRYEAVAAEIPPGSSVVEACAGDCYLYDRFLRQKGVRYLALDASKAFVRHARGRGIDAREIDLAHGELPVADVVLLQASLYQFLPAAAPVLRKLIAAARQKVVVAEPVRNLSSSRLGWLGALSRRLTRMSPTSPPAARFNEASLGELFRNTPEFTRAFLIPGGREMVGVFTGTAT